MPMPDSPRTLPLLPLQGVTILLVEDSRYVADACRLMAQCGGARLRRAATLATARRHLVTYRPDVLLVDMGLPDGSGSALLAEVAALAGPAPVLIAISGDPDAGPAALQAGARAFLAKPLPPLAEFHALLLRHLPDRPCVALPPGTALRGPDPLALREDLLHAAQLLDHPADAAQRAYLAGFLAGLARETGDGQLAGAAADLARRDQPARQLAGLVAQRIGQMPAAFG